MNNTLDELKNAGECTSWLQEEGYQTIKNGYLLPNETQKGAFARMSKAAAKYAGAKYEQAFFNAMWNNWLCPASPVFSNLGTNRGLPISCNSIHIDDSVNSIFQKNHELAMLTKHGAGVGIYIGDIRGRGKDINGNGKSEGVIPWAKVYDATTIAVSQGSTRRGATALYLPIEHRDIDEFLDIRRPTGDINRRVLNTNHAVTIPNTWMESMLAGDKSKQEIWKKILKTRMETGEPYLMFIDTVNDNNPEAYVKNNLQVKTSNICSEIVLYTDPNHTFVCCLSSLNLTKWHEWKDTNLIEISTRFLDAVLSEYIEKGQTIPGLECSIQSAVKGRAVGLGVLGWHTLLQESNYPFDSLQSMLLNAEIFKKMHDESIETSKELAKEFGEPEWCKGTGMRNTHLMSIAPTVSNATISGSVSQAIEPIAANIYSQKSAKGTFIRKNPTLQKRLQELEKDTSEIWKKITENSGSIQGLGILSEEDEKVFLTAREINQFAIIKQAAQRQQYIDQSQSINLFFASNSDAKYINEVHLEAWKTGMKTLYYLRSEGVLKGDLASRSSDECAACEA